MAQGHVAGAEEGKEKGKEGVIPFLWASLGFVKSAESQLLLVSRNNSNKNHAY